VVVSLLAERDAALDNVATSSQMGRSHSLRCLSLAVASSGGANSAHKSVSNTCWATGWRSAWGLAGEQEQAIERGARMRNIGIQSSAKRALTPSSVRYTNDRRCYSQDRQARSLIRRARYEDAWRESLQSAAVSRFGHGGRVDGEPRGHTGLAGDVRTTSTLQTDRPTAGLDGASSGHGP
jgi:hypothetical protein